ncbi:MAG: SAM hydrolase/SAM-dependent halogenase family protein [Candidatus Binataceae bacterium]
MQVKTRFPIAILTDFGYRDHYVAAMKGVIGTIAPQAPIIDITHGVPAQSVVAGALALEQCWRYFPKGTVFLAVVDPGVGTARLPIAVETRAGARFVGPDNGLMWLAARQATIARVIELRAPRYRLPQTSATFHGRDVFAPAAAHLWRGVRLGLLGPERESLEQLSVELVDETPSYLRGAVIYEDGYGNLVTNVDRAAVERLVEHFRGCRLSVRIGRGAPIEIRRTYADAPRGASLATFGSFNLLEVAVRDGSAAARFKAGVGARITVRPAKGG